MSVTMNLYRVLSDISYKGYYVDFTKKSDYILNQDGFYPFELMEIAMGAPVNEKGHIPIFGGENFDAYEKWEKEQKKSAWSDGVTHEKFDLTLFDSYNRKNRAWKRYRKCLNSFNFKTFDNKNGYIQKYLVVDTVKYAQGWFFNKTFFNKKYWTFICTTKEQMGNFFNRYVDIKKNPEIKEVLYSFLNSWEDGMIFECSF